MASDALGRFGISRDELEAMIQRDAEVNSELNDFMENEVVPYAKSISHRRSSAYAASIKVTKKAKRGAGRVGATVWYAHFIEYGTKADKKGKDPRRVFTKNGWVTLPKDTPTEAQGVMEQTARHFGGELGPGGTGGIKFDAGEDDE